MAATHLKTVGKQATKGWKVSGATKKKTEKHVATNYVYWQQVGNMIRCQK